MIVVVFEAEPSANGFATYLEHAVRVKPLLAEIGNFISIEQFQSLITPKKMVYQVNFELNNIRAKIRTHPATVGDATRVLPLSHSPDHKHYTATELAQYTGMTAATVLARLKQMNDEYLIKVRAQGTHRYFMLTDSKVAPALEALLCVV